MAWGYTTIWSTQAHFFMLDHKAAILEDGLDITSRLEREDYSRDVIGEILHRLEDVIIEEIILGLKLNLKGNEDPQRIIRKLKKCFESKKLAVIYLLDGSKFEAMVREKMAGPWKHRKSKENYRTR